MFFLATLIALWFRWRFKLMPILLIIGTQKWEDIFISFQEPFSFFSIPKMFRIETIDKPSVSILTC